MASADTRSGDGDRWRRIWVSSSSVVLLSQMTSVRLNADALYVIGSSRRSVSSYCLTNQAFDVRNESRFHFRVKLPLSLFVTKESISELLYLFLPFRVAYLLSLTVLFDYAMSDYSMIKTIANQSKALRANHSIFRCHYYYETFL